jgi:hypothetical protein
MDVFNSNGGEKKKGPLVYSSSLLSVTWRNSDSNDVSGSTVDHNDDLCFASGFGVFPRRNQDRQTRAGQKMFMEEKRDGQSSCRFFLK